MEKGHHNLPRDVDEKVGACVRLVWMSAARKKDARERGLRRRRRPGRRGRNTSLSTSKIEIISQQSSRAARVTHDSKESMPVSPKQQHQSQQLLATTEPMMYLTGSYKKGSRSSPSALQTQSANPDVADIRPTFPRGHTDGASSRAGKKWETCQISVFTSFSARMRWSGSRQALTTS